MKLQIRIHEWIVKTFGSESASNVSERSFRFLEESLELCQASGMTKLEAYRLVDYTFDRAIGVASQEVGGVVLTLSALCSAQNIDMILEGETELDRVMSKIEVIREKNLHKIHRINYEQML